MTKSFAREEKSPVWVNPSALPRVPWYNEEIGLVLDKVTIKVYPPDPVLIGYPPIQRAWYRRRGYDIVGHLRLSQSQARQAAQLVQVYQTNVPPMIEIVCSNVWMKDAQSPIPDASIRGRAYVTGADYVPASDLWYFGAIMGGKGITDSPPDAIDFTFTIIEEESCRLFLASS